MDILTLIISCVGMFFCGFVAGSIFEATRNRAKNKPVGTLKVNNSDPDGPYLFLELSTYPEDIMREEYVTMKVETRE